MAQKILYKLDSNGNKIGSFNSVLGGYDHVWAIIPNYLTNSVLVGGYIRSYNGDTTVKNLIRVDSSSGAILPMETASGTNTTLLISFALFTPGIGSLTVRVNGIPTVYTTNTPYVEMVVAKGSNLLFEVKGIGSGGAIATKTLVVDEDNVGNRHNITQSTNISTTGFTVNNVTNIQAEVS